MSKTRLYASPLGSKPAAKINKKTDIPANAVAVALCRRISLRPALILSIPGSAIISLFESSTIASCFHNDERRIREVMPLSPAMNEGAIETNNIGIHTIIIKVGRVNG